LEVRYETRVVSAHRTPDLMAEYASGAAERGLQVVIAGAGGAAHLPGMTAAHTHLPVLGVPVESHALKGMDSLLSIVQMPAGVPVGTTAIGRAGAVNAALLAASIVALSDDGGRERLRAFRATQTQTVLDNPDPAGERPMRVAIGGGGPLGRMLVQAGEQLGIACVTLDPAADSPAAQVGPAIVGGYDDATALATLVDGADVVTYEFENVP